MLLFFLLFGANLELAFVTFELNVDFDIIHKFSLHLV